MISCFRSKAAKQQRSKEAKKQSSKEAKEAKKHRSKEAIFFLWGIGLAVGTYHWHLTIIPS
jgi:uncharacterized membrane protein